MKPMNRVLRIRVALFAVGGLLAAFSFVTEERSGVEAAAVMFATAAAFIVVAGRYREQTHLQDDD